MIGVSMGLPVYDVFLVKLRRENPRWRGYVPAIIMTTTNKLITAKLSYLGQNKAQIWIQSEISRLESYYVIADLRKKSADFWGSVW